MTGKDKVFAQNWIEQWRYNTGRYPMRSPWDIHSTEQLFGLRSTAGDLVHYAFHWRITPQGHDLWSERDDNIGQYDLTR